MIPPALRAFALLLVFFSVTSIASTGEAQMLLERGPPKHRIVQRHLAALRYNPLGLLHEARLSYRLRLYEHESVALRDNFIGGGAMLIQSPAFARVGPYVELGVATIASVWSSLQFVGYYGTFDLFQSFPSPRSDVSDTAIGDAGETAYSTTGLEWTVGLDLQLKLGPIVARTRSRVVYANYDMRDGDRVYYDQLYDVIMPDDGWMFTTDVDVLYQSPDGHFIGGLRYTGSTPLYADRHFAPGDERDNPNAIHRVGPLIGYTFSMEDGSAFNAPTVFLLAQWWLSHRFRTGEDTSQALPLVGIGFQFFGDLLPLD